MPFANVVRLPHLLGADHVGEVAGVGDEVREMSPGERVAVFPVLSCGRCAACDQ